MLCYVLYCCSLHVQAWQLITNFKLSDTEWVQTCQGPDLSMCIGELSDLGSVVINLSQARFLTQSHFSTFVMWDWDQKWASLDSLALSLVPIVYPHYM